MAMYKKAVEPPLAISYRKALEPLLKVVDDIPDAWNEWMLSSKSGRNVRRPSLI